MLKQMVRTVRVYYRGLKGLTDMSACLTPWKWRSCGGLVELLWRGHLGLLESFAFPQTEDIESDRISWPWRRHHCPSKRLLLFTSWHVVISLKTWIFLNSSGFATGRVPTPFQSLVSTCTEIRVSGKWTVILTSKKSTSHASGIRYSIYVIFRREFTLL